MNDSSIILPGAIILRDAPAKQTVVAQPGMTVAPIERPGGTAWLRSGAEGYPYAVVVSADPFMLVSPRGDMVWRNHKAEDFHQVGWANAEETKAVDARLQYEAEQGVRAEAEDLVRRAEEAGVILTITQQPQQPLAMGHYKTVVEVREDRSK